VGAETSDGVELRAARSEISATVETPREASSLGPRSGSDPERFADRREAGERLARALVGRGVRAAVVLAIPRGGVPVAAEVARALGAGLDVVVAKKIGVPGNPELALGAVTASGTRVLNAEFVAELAAGDAWLERATASAREVALQKETLLRAGREPFDVRGLSVLVVDDGLATGATALACVRDLRTRGAVHVMLAVPVGSREACALLRAEVEDLTCLVKPLFFAAVGEFYDDFAQVSDEEARAILRSFQRAAPQV
jgi:predicted phosphoribosyltransferase